MLMLLCRSNFGGLGSNLGGDGSYIGGVILFECGSYIGAHPLLSTRSLPPMEVILEGKFIKLEYLA